jgi:hypothetical protein
MKKEKENDLKTGSRSPLLPGHLEEKSYRSALEFDKYTGMGDASDSRIPVWGMEWLPPITDGSNRVRGNLACVLPQIKIIEKKYIFHSLCGTK